MGTKEVVEFITQTKYEQIPKEAIRIAKRCMIDTIGVAIAASKQPEGKIITELTKEKKAVPEASVIVGGFKTSSDLAALANGTMAHGLDYDDTSIEFRGHPSGVLVPAVLALSECYRKSGRDTLCSFVIGFEVGAMIGDAMGDPFFYDSPWHPTPIVGIMGAVAAGAKILGLSAQQSAMALGIASSMAGGLKENVGTMTKPLHAGNAAHNSILAVLLANKGLTAGEGILEGKRGLYKAFMGREYPKGIERSFGKRWSIVTPGVKVKLYPCCGGLFGAIYSMLELKKKYNLLPEDVAEIECRISQAELTLLEGLLTEFPKTIPESRFSLKYVTAIALLDGEVSLRQFNEQKVSSSMTKDLMHKIRVVPLHFDDVGHSIDSPQEVIVKLKNGREYSYQVAWGNVKGNTGNPLSDDELASKFRDCASLALSPNKVDEALELFWHLEDLKDITKLMKLVGVADLK